MTADQSSPPLAIGIAFFSLLWFVACTWLLSCREYAPVTQEVVERVGPSAEPSASVPPVASSSPTTQP